MKRAGVSFLVVLCLLAASTAGAEGELLQTAVSNGSISIEAYGNDADISIYDQAPKPKRH